MDKNSIGKRVRRQRENLSLSREQFAERIDISMQFLAEIENGTKGMSAETLYKICDRTGVSSDYLLFGKQASGGVAAPISETLRKIPAQYTDLADDALRVILKVIETAANNEKDGLDI